jgi:hypothetical protein
MWAEHESSHMVPSTAKCPFCGANFQQRALVYFKHVAAHLQEVSLSVLPHPADEDDGFDSEDSNNEDTSSISDPNLTENIQHDSSLGQKESLSQSEQVRVLSEPTAVAGPSNHGHNDFASASLQAALESENEIGMDFIIDRLLEVRRASPGKQVQLLDREARYLCSPTGMFALPKLMSYVSIAAFTQARLTFGSGLLTPITRRGAAKD